MWSWWRRLTRLVQRAASRTAGPEASAAVEAGAAKSAEALYCDVARARLNAQLAQVDTVDSKASAMFAIGSTILPITASLLAGERDVIADCAVAKYALVAGAAFYVALVGTFTWSYKLAQWDSRPELGQWKEITRGRQEEEMQRWLGDACVEAYQANKPQLEKKGRFVAAGLWCLALEAAALTVAVLAPLF
jgi:hypothetical protein